MLTSMIAFTYWVISLYLQTNISARFENKIKYRNNRAPILTKRKKNQRKNQKNNIMKLKFKFKKYDDNIII